jgi:hypothetical protein
MDSPLFLFPGGARFFPFKNDAFGIGRRIEDEGLIVEGGCEVPSEGVAVLWPGVVGEGGDDEPARERELPELDPDLPVDVFLVASARRLHPLRGRGRRRLPS